MAELHDLIKSVGTWLWVMITNLLLCTVCRQDTGYIEIQLKYIQIKLDMTDLYFCNQAELMYINHCKRLDETHQHCQKSGINQAVSLSKFQIKLFQMFQKLGSPKTNSSEKEKLQ